MTQTKHSKNNDVIDDAVMDQLLDSVTPVQPPESLRAKTLQKIRGQTLATITIRQSDGWVEFAPGLQYKILFVDQQANSKSFLLRAEPGSRMPPHGHHGNEECLVLEGEFTIGDLRLTAGDFHCANASVQHAESFTEQGVLVYLKSDIRDYPEVRAA